MPNGRLWLKADIRKYTGIWGITTVVIINNENEVGENAV